MLSSYSPAHKGWNPLILHALSARPKLVEAKTEEVSARKAQICGSIWHECVYSARY